MKKQLCFLSLFFAITLNIFAQKTYLHCGRLIDGSSQLVQSEVTIVVEGNKIVDIQKGYTQATDNEKLVDLKNKTVLPGLMDMHVHIEGEYSKNSYLHRFTLNDADRAFVSTVHARTTLMSGFTTIRDLGGSGVNIALRNAINKGLVIGPRIYTAGKSIAITGGHADPTNGYSKKLMQCMHVGPSMGVADGPDACRQAVRQQVKNGADCIKIS